MLDRLDLAIFAHSGMGKTMLVEKFRRDNPPTVHPAHGLESTPVPASL